MPSCPLRETCNEPSLYATAVEPPRAEHSIHGGDHGFPVDISKHQKNARGREAPGLKPQLTQC